LVLLTIVHDTGTYVLLEFRDNAEN
jgi:hypothetical protein